MPAFVTEPVVAGGPDGLDDVGGAVGGEAEEIAEDDDGHAPGGGDEALELAAEEAVVLGTGVEGGNEDGGGIRVGRGFARGDQFGSRSEARGGECAHGKWCGSDLDPQPNHSGAERERVKVFAV